jgi:hypothetical protein
VDQLEDATMHTTQVAELARQLLDAHGDRAALEAAQKMHQAEARGDRQEAESWRRIRAAIHELRPPHVS